MNILMIEDDKDLCEAVSFQGLEQEELFRYCLS